MKKITKAATTVLLLITFHYGNAQFANYKYLIDSLRAKGINVVAYPSFKSGFINSSVARDMSKEYAKDAGKAQVKKTKRKDARSIWFDMEKLDNFITKIKQVSPYKGKRLKLGIRIYYILYPESLSDASLKDLSPSVTGRHTVMMVPTYFDETTNTNIDFSFAFKGDSSMPLPYWRVLELDKKDTAIFSLGESYSIKKLNTLPMGVAGAGASASIENHGGLSPPPDNGGTFPTPSGPAQQSAASALRSNAAPAKPFVKNNRY